MALHTNLRTGVLRAFMQALAVPVSMLDTQETDEDIYDDMMLQAF